MGLALAVGVYPQLESDLPAVDPVWLNILVPIVAIVLRLVTTGPVGGKYWR